MPPTTLQTFLMTDIGKREVVPRMDTILIEPDHRRVTLVFRQNVAREARESRIREIVIGPVTQGYLRAKERGKIYLDFKNPQTSIQDIPE